MANTFDERPSLEEILSSYELDETDLEGKCPMDIRLNIATKLTDWRMVGHYLGFPAEKLHSIACDYSTEDQRKVALLDSWSEREGRRASCLKLATVLHDRERADLVELLCRQVRDSLSLSNRSSINSHNGKELQACKSGRSFSVVWH